VSVERCISDAFREQLRNESLVALREVAEPDQWLAAQCPGCERTFAVFIASSSLRGSTTLGCPYVCGETVGSAFSAFHLREGAPEPFPTCRECNCGSRYAFSGVIGMCPVCAHHDSRTYFLRGLQRLLDRLKQAPAVNLPDETRAVLNDAVALFDGYGRATVRAWSGGLASGERISFQNLEGARTNLMAVRHESGHPGHTWTFDLAAAVDEADWAHAKRCFQKRHLLAHKLGVVDQDYLRKADDPHAVLGAPVQVAPEEVQRLLPILAELGKRLYGFYVS
jgi:hypothetical protein